VRPAELKRVLQRVRRGTLSPALAARAIAEAPFERLEFATLDHQRALRVGFPEVVFGLGKSPKQLVAIVGRLVPRHAVVLATRVDEAGRAALAAGFPGAEVHDRARVVIVRASRRASPASRSPRATRVPRAAGRVVVVCAGTADLPVAEEALLTARVLGSRAELIADVGVAGLHRLLAHRRALRGARVLVVVAGLEGALPSVVGGLTDRPVIAVPTSVGYGAHFRGLAPLLAMLNSCAAGVTVVNVDNGFGAGYAAHLINTTGGRR
jgi:NCAIR mutase (PurE)-related protein